MAWRAVWLVQGDGSGSRLGMCGRVSENNLGVWRLGCQDVVIHLRRKLFSVMCTGWIRIGKPQPQAKSSLTAVFVRPVSKGWFLFLSVWKKKVNNIS